jgi:hypothetical protein
VTPPSHWLEVSPRRDRDISTGKLRSCQVSSIVGVFDPDFQGGGRLEEGRRKDGASLKIQGGGRVAEGRRNGGIISIELA